jgi:sulfoquinovosyltransferase
MVAQGAEVLVVTTGAGRSIPGVPFAAGVAPPSEFAGAQVVGAPSFGCPLYWQAPLSFALSPGVWSRLRSFKPDVIHVTSPGVMLLAAGLYARRLDTPLVMSYHTDVPSYVERYGFGFLKPLLWACIRAAHRAAHFSVAASETLAGVLVAQKAAPRRLTGHWRKAVDCEAFNPKWRSTEARATLAAPARPAEAAGTDDEDEPLLLYVGRLGAEKNVEFLRPLLASVPRARLAVVGDGPARDELEAAFAADPAVAGRVRFAGTLRGAALSAAFASADVFVMPSETETLGFVVLEAMASGLPVVAVAAGGIPDIITNPGENGFLYPPGDGEAASRAVRALLRDGALRERVGQAAREESTRWDWAAATHDLLTQQYPRAVAAHRAGLHRAQPAPQETAGGDVAAGSMLANTAKLVALRKVASRARLATGGARKAGRALMRRALTTVL